MPNDESISRRREKLIDLLKAYEDDTETLADRILAVFDQMQRERAIAESQAPQPSESSFINWADSDMRPPSAIAAPMIRTTEKESICASDANENGLGHTKNRANVPAAECMTLGLNRSESNELGDGEPSPPPVKNTPVRFICRHGDFPNPCEICQGTFTNSGAAQEVSPPSPSCDCHGVFWQNCPTYKMGLCITISPEGGECAESEQNQAIKQSSQAAARYEAPPLSNEPSALDTTTTRTPCGVQDHADAAQIVGERGDTRELKAALREARGMLKILTRRLRPESVQEFLDRTERLLGEPTKEPK